MVHKNLILVFILCAMALTMLSGCVSPGPGNKTADFSLISAKALSADVYFGCDVNEAVRDINGSVVTCIPVGSGGGGGVDTNTQTAGWTNSSGAYLIDLNLNKKSIVDVNRLLVNNFIVARDYNLNIDSSVPSTPSVALAGLGAGNVNNGAHAYVVVFYNAFGRSTISSTASVTIVDNNTNGQVAITNIPVSSRADVIGRKIYRTTIAGSYSGGGRYYLLTTIANNTATTYTDNIADATINTNTAEVIMADSPALMNSTTWDATRFYNGKTLQTTTKDYDELFYDTTYDKPFFALDRSAGRLWLGDPDKFKISQFSPTFMYVDTDVANSNAIATYIVPSGSTRLYFGASDSKLYSINFGGVGSFESFPGYFAMSSNTNGHNFGTSTSSAIASSGNKNLMLTTASGTTGVYISSSGSATTSTRVFPFLTYAQNGDSYKWTGSHYYFNTFYNDTNSGTDFPYQTKWLSAGGLLGGIKMNGVFQIPKLSPITDSTTGMQFFKADGITAVATIDTTNSRVGIGTTAPAYKLDVNGTTNSTAYSVGGVAGIDLNMGLTNKSGLGCFATYKKGILTDSNCGAW
jgi:hypothetical protein